MLSTGGISVAPASSCPCEFFVLLLLCCKAPPPAYDTTSHLPSCTSACTCVLGFCPPPFFVYMHWRRGDKLGLSCVAGAAPAVRALH